MQLTFIWHSIGAADCGGSPVLKIYWLSHADANVFTLSLSLRYSLLNKVRKKPDSVSLWSAIYQNRTIRTSLGGGGQQLLPITPYVIPFAERNAIHNGERNFIIPFAKRPFHETWKYLLCANRYPDFPIDFHIWRLCIFVDIRSVILKNRES